MIARMGGRYRIVYAPTLIVMAISGIHGYIASSPGLRTHDQAVGPQVDVKDTGLDESSPLSVKFTNEYPAIVWSPWEHLAEPWRETTLTAHSKVGDASADVFHWSIPKSEGAAYEGREVTHVFKEVGRQLVRLTQTVVATGEQLHTEVYVMVKYVRREIRDLTDADRTAFFDVLESMYRLTAKEGNHLYGDDYKGIDFYVQMHLDGAGKKECDHWHDDAGIMTHHVGYTMMFEQSMQLINPAVTIPYWEYTLDARELKGTYEGSDIFDDEWFGSSSPNNALHTVDTGRFAFLSVMPEAWDYVHNPFGLLRSPWNLDPTPFVTRHNTTNGQVAYAELVSCFDFMVCFQKDNLGSMNNCLNGGTHGPVHITVGGIWNNPEEEFIQNLGTYVNTPLITKFLWRKGYLRMPETCEAPEDILENGGDSTTCRSSCPAEYYENLNMTPYDVLMDVHALFWESTFANGVLSYDPTEDEFYVAGHRDDKEFSDKFWKKMLTAFCDVGHVGEMYTSAAPYDPVFWVIHPTAERLLNYRRMVGREVPGFEFLEKWGYDHEKQVVGETGVVCDWSDVREGTLDMPTCVKETCGGHNEYDMLPFEIKLKGETVIMNNAEWLDFIYPTNDELPYMYDNFDWGHCSSAGFGFGPEGGIAR